MDSIITIGLPDGAHLRKLICELFERAHIRVERYFSNDFLRKYSSVLVLPSGNKILVLIDKPRDLVYSLIEGRCDAIITGSDYVEDFLLFLESHKDAPENWRERKIVSGHKRRPHLNFSGLRMSVIVSDENNSTDINELIKNKDTVCYTEFPFIAAKYLQSLPGYKDKYGSTLPRIWSTFSGSGGDPTIDIIFSSGATESKILADTQNIAVDLVHTGETVRENGLRVIDSIGAPVFNTLYVRSDVIDEKTKLLSEFVDLVEENVEGYR